MRRSVTCSLILLLFVSAITAQTPSPVITAIREEALRDAESKIGRPLPLAGHWNLGEAKDGFAPDYQLKMIEQGHHLLPWFLMPNVHAHPQDPRWLDYYETPLKRAVRLRLPISLISTQWEAMLSVDGKYVDLPPDQNPNVVTADGMIRREVSPFGPLGTWHEVGMKWASSPMMKRLQEWYSDPPLVLFISNHEHSKLQWNKVEQDRRFMKLFGAGGDDDFKRKITGDGWIARYRALQRGVRDGLVSQKWKDSARFIAYDAFGPSHFARWPGWIEHSLYSAGRIDPWPFAWDGASPSFYVFNWSSITDYTVFSPQVEAMSWVFMLDEVRRINPNFWFELSTWDGHDPGAANDKRKFYERAGQSYSPERYGGMVKFGMWLLRPRVVREFRGYQETLSEAERYFLPIVEAIDSIHKNSTLREFWRRGRLVANRHHQHPYQTSVPKEYQSVERWFLLDTSLDPKRPWELGTPLPVYALTLVMGAGPKRQWLLYAHAPAGARQSVQVVIPEYRTVTINVSVSGSFYLVDEKSRRVQAVN